MVDKASDQQPLNSDLSPRASSDRWADSTLPSWRCARPVWARRTSLRLNDGQSGTSRSDETDRQLMRVTVVCSSVGVARSLAAFGRQRAASELANGAAAPGGRRPAERAALEIVETVLTNTAILPPSVASSSPVGSRRPRACEHGSDRGRPHCASALPAEVWAR